MENGRISLVMRLVLLQSVHSMFEIGPGKGDDISRQSNSDVAVGNAQQWGREQRERIGGFCITPRNGTLGLTRHLLDSHRMNVGDALK